jgi:hypothetical protein
MSAKEMLRVATAAAFLLGGAATAMAAGSSGTAGGNGAAGSSGAASGNGAAGTNGTESGSEGSANTTPSGVQQQGTAGMASSSGPAMSGPGYTTTVPTPAAQPHGNGGNGSAANGTGANNGTGSGNDTGSGAGNGTGKR